jgi:hypothetical protein
VSQSLLTMMTWLVQTPRLLRDAALRLRTMQAVEMALTGVLVRLPSSCSPPRHARD